MKIAEQTMPFDLVDDLISQWRRELPETQLSGMKVVGRVILLGRILEERVEKILEPYGLIYTDFDILATLRRSGHPFCLSPTELRNSVLITSGAMTAAMNRLEKLGYIKREKGLDDGRVVNAFLTETGKALSLKTAMLRFEDANKSIADLSSVEETAVTFILQKLLESSLIEKDDV